MPDENLDTALAAIREIVKKHDLFAQIIIVSKESTNVLIVPNPTWGGIQLVEGEKPGYAKLSFKDDYPTDEAMTDAQVESIEAVMSCCDAMVNQLRDLKKLGDQIHARLE